MNAACEAARLYAALFDDDRFFIELHHHRRPYDDQRVAALVEVAQSLKLGYVAANHVHYPTPAEKPLGALPSLPARLEQHAAHRRRLPL